MLPKEIAEQKPFVKRIAKQLKASRPKWKEKQVKDAIKALRDALIFIRCEQPLSFKEALDYAERYIKAAREEHRCYMDACQATGMIEASPEALYYRRYGKFYGKCYGEKIGQKYLRTAHNACKSKKGDINYNMRKYVEKNVPKQSRVWRGRRTYWVCKQHLEQDIEKFLQNNP